MNIEYKIEAVCVNGNKITPMSKPGCLTVDSPKGANLAIFRLFAEARRRKIRLSCVRILVIDTDEQKILDSYLYKKEAHKRSFATVMIME